MVTGTEQSHAERAAAYDRVYAHGGSVAVSSLTYFWAATFRTPGGR